MLALKQKQKGTIWYFITALILSAVLIRVFIFDSFTVVGNSMAPTIQEGDHVFVNKLAYKWREPARNDIVVGDFRGLEGTKAIKRLVGLPGEWIRLNEGILTVTTERDGIEEKVAEVAVVREDMASLDRPYEYKLDPYEYFLSGDNEISSIDSYELGPVDSYRLDGRVIGLLRLSDLKYIKF